MNWIRKIIFLGAFFSVLSLASQSKVYTYIQETNTSYSDKSYFFIKVVDARKSKSNIGMIYTSNPRKKYPAHFKKDLATAFDSFLKKTFNNPNSPNKVVMVVNEFEIDHIKTEEKKDVGSAKGNFDFYLLKQDSCYLISHETPSLIEESADVPISHPNRIKRLLLMAVNSMEKQLLELDPNYSLNNHYSFDSILRKGGTRSNANDELQAQNLPNYYMFQTGAYYSLSPEMMLMGLTANLVLQVKKYPQFLIGGNAELMLFGWQTETVTSGQTFYQVVNYNLGIKLLKQIKNQWFFNFNPMAVLGKTEAIANTSTTSNAPASESIYGFELDLGAYLIPPKMSGPYIGLNLFIRTTNNSVFLEGGGFKLDLGYRF